jgi:DNA polymerase III epsilon subunit-like protein
VLLKPRGAPEPIPWQEVAVDSADVTSATPLEDAEYVALDVETTGNRPFLVLELGAERFRLEGPLSFFDTLVDCRAPINPYARRRHLIDRSMLVGAPEFSDARRAFLRFAHGAVLVEHSHDAFDTWLVGRGLERPLDHPIIDTTALARLVMELPKGQTPGLARLVAELGLDYEPEHAALGDARATAAVFRELIARGRALHGWATVGDVLAVLVRPEVDRSGLEGGKPKPSAPAQDARQPATGTSAASRRRRARRLRRDRVAAGAGADAKQAVDADQPKRGQPAEKNQRLRRAQPPREQPEK